MSKESTTSTPEVKPPKKGRPRNKNFLSYEEAREMVRNEMLHSRAAYEHWWDREKPKTIPRFPYRVYTKEWVSWNDFLGTNNEFRVINKAWRPFKEAVLYAHTLHLKSYNDWMEYVKINAEQWPEDIPKRPDVAYDKWVSWTHWLGNKPVEALQAKVESASVAVYYIIHEQDVPGNVLTYGVEHTGLTAMKDWWEREKFDIVKLFQYEPDRGNDIQHVINALSTPFLGEDQQRITPNVWQIIEHLQTIMLTVNSAQRADKLVKV